MLVEDGVAIVLAQGHATAADRLWRFAEALELAHEELRRMTRAVARGFR